MTENIKIFPLGDDALTVELGDEISETLNLRAIGLESFFERNRFPGLIETVPAYASLTIFYDPRRVRQSFPQFATAFAAVKALAEKALLDPSKTTARETRLVEIPVRFDEDSAPDLGFVAARAGRTPAQVVELFTARIYRVFMLGFLPGFAYMGQVDERIAAPRQTAPRLEVSKGSVGIAGRQTGIYPAASPGGWQIIGRTDTELFTPETENPCLFRPGDAVRFYRV